MFSIWHISVQLAVRNVYSFDVIWRQNFNIEMSQTMFISGWTMLSVYSMEWSFLFEHDSLWGTFWDINWSWKHSCLDEIIEGCSTWFQLCQDSSLPLSFSSVHLLSGKRGRLSSSGKMSSKSFLVTFRGSYTSPSHFSNTFLCQIASLVNFSQSVPWGIKYTHAVTAH